MWLAEWWRQWRADAPQRRTRRAIAGVRRDSEWLAKRPFSDKYDGDDRAGGYFASAGGTDLSPEGERLAKRKRWR